MSGAKQKWVITHDKNFKFGRVGYHFELSQSSRCGGYWFFDKETKTLYLYSESVQFGSCSVTMMNELKDKILSTFKNAEKVIFEPDPNVPLVKLLVRDMDLKRAEELMEINGWI